MIRMDPPGTFCQTAAVCDMIDRNARSFVDVGCGNGSLSKALCDRGMEGVGVDLSSEAVRLARAVLAEQIAVGRYDTMVADVRQARIGPCDVAVSMMVAEHVEDDQEFVRAVAQCVRPGGQVIIGVPGRRSHWGFEDEVSGHLRRYERPELERLLRSCGLEHVVVWSVAVPVANLLYRIGNLLVRRSAGAELKNQASLEQTLSSGIREVPWKTVFPRWCRLLLNRRALYPLFVLQRLFYGSSYGITILASGRRPEH